VPSDISISPAAIQSRDQPTHFVVLVNLAIFDKIELVSD